MFFSKMRKTWNRPVRAFTDNRPQHRKGQQRQLLFLEPLEDRTLLTAWTAMGPAPLAGTNSGRVTGIAADPGNANIVYVAAAGGGVWKTTDAQEANPKWTPLTDNIPGTTDSYGAIAIAPSNATVLYAGTGETSTASFNNYGNGILVSKDGGSSWTLENPGGIFTKLTVSKIVVDPTNADVAYAALSNHGANTNWNMPGTGIYKTSDGGVTWTNTTTSITTTHPFTDVALDPKNPNTLYAALSSDRALTYDDTGIYKSIDGGSSWSLLANFAHGTNYSRIVLAVSDSNPSVIYASAVNKSGNGLAEMGVSTDGGSTWTNLTNTPDLYVFTLAVDPLNSAVVYAGTVDGPGFPNDLIETTNSGASWTSIARDDNRSWGGGDFRTLAFDANNHLLEGNDGGIYRQDSDPNNANGFLWTDLTGNLNTIQFNSVSINASNGNVLGNGKDNGVDLYDAATGKWTPVEFGDFGMVAFATSTLAYNSQPAIYVPTDFFCVSNDGGKTWTPAISGLDSTDTGLAFAIDPSNPNRVVYGATQLYQTTNAANNWTKLTSTGVNGWDPKGYAVGAIGLAASDANTIYASTGAKGQIFVSSDGGATWTERDLPKGSGLINQILVDPTNAQTAYAVISTFGGGHVFKTTDGGETWTDISGNLPDLPTWSIQLDATYNVLFVGNDQGVYTSTDGGATWSRFGTGFPNVRVFSLDYDFAMKILLAGTYGRGAWEIPVTYDPPQVTTDPTDQNVMAGQTATFTAAAIGYPPPTVQWQVSTDGGNSFSNVSGATSSTLTLNNVRADMNGNEYRAVFTNSLGLAVTSTATLTIQHAPNVTINPSNQTVTAGRDAAFRAAVDADPAATVQWQVSTDRGPIKTFRDINGATSTTLMLPAVSADMDGNEYQAVFTNSIGSATTSAATLTVQYAPSVTTDPTDQTVTTGNNASFTAEADGNPLPRVQWQVSSDGGKSFSAISGATSTTFVLPAVTAGMNGNEYQAVFTNSIGSATTSAAMLTVQYAPIVTSNPSDQTVNTGQSVAFTAAAEGNPAAAVQWQVSSDGGKSFSNISGATSTTLTLNNVAGNMNGEELEAVFTNNTGTTSTLAALLTVDYPPSVTVNPSDQTVAVGNSATFTVAAGGNPTPTVQWEISRDGGKSFNDIKGATSTVLKLDNVTTDMNGNEYDAILTSSLGTAASSSATLTIATAPTITVNPANQTVAAGGNVSFAASAGGNPPPTVQWQVSTNNGSTWNVLNGATATTLALHNITADSNGAEYRAIFTNSAGTATTLAASLTVEYAPTVTIEPMSQVVIAGNNASFTAAAGGNPLPSMHWQVSSDGGKTFSNISGATSTTLTLANVTASMNGNLYHALFTNSTGDAVSSAAALTVLAPPPSAPSPPFQPPVLHKPPLLVFIDGILGGIETVIPYQSETVIDGFFGFPLFVSTYDGSGNLKSVTFFGIDVTFLLG